MVEELNLEKMEEMEKEEKTEEKTEVAEEPAEEKTGVTECGIDDLEIKEPASQFEPTEYEGKIVKLKKPEIKEVIDWYTGEEQADGGRAYNPNSTEKKKVIEIATENLRVIKDGEETSELLKLGENYVSVTHRFNLKKEITESGSVEWVISKHQKAALWKFMRKKVVNKPSELEGKTVSLTVEPATDEKDDRVFLRIVV